MSHFRRFLMGVDRFLRRPLLRFHYALFCTYQLLYASPLFLRVLLEYSGAGSTPCRSYRFPALILPVLRRCCCCPH